MGAWPADRPTGWPTGRGALGRPRTSSRRWPGDSTCRRAARPPKTSNRCPPPTRMADRQQGSTAATCQPQRSAPCDGHWCSGHIGSSAISTAPVHQEDAGSCGALWVASRSRAAVLLASGYHGSTWVRAPGELNPLGSQAIQGSSWTSSATSVSDEQRRRARPGVQGTVPSTFHRQRLHQGDAGDAGGLDIGGIDGLEGRPRADVGGPREAGTLAPTPCRVCAVRSCVC